MSVVKESMLDNIEALLKEYKHYSNEEITKIKNEAKRYGRGIIDYLIEIKKDLDEDEILNFFSRRYNIPKIEDVSNKKIIKKSDYYIIYDGNEIGISFPAYRHILSEKYPDYKIGLIKYSVIRGGNYEEEGIKGDFINLEKDAKNLNVTDIHFSNKDFGGVIHYRLLGDLVEVKTMKKDYVVKFLKVIKNLASEFTPGFDPEEYRQPQDARIEIEELKLGNRINFTPSLYEGRQNFVIRLINKEQKRIKGIEDLYNLGYLKEDAEKILSYSQLNTGLIIMSGATGSGKSKTFNTLLALLPKTKKIVSAEDPVEYKLDNAVQHQTLEFIKKEAGKDKLVKVGYMEYMRAFMRQDPDIIFIGEWRKDKELTESLVYASETGHLVFTTLHSSRVINVPNLLITQYGLMPTDLTNNVKLLINQRLIKKVCPYCGKKHIVTDEEIDEIKKIIWFKDKDKLDILKGKEIFMPGDGCEKCIIKDFSGKILSKGYIRRTAIYEYLPFDDEVKDLLLSTTSTNEIEKILIKKSKENEAKTFTDVVVEKALNKELDIASIKEGLL